MSCPLNTSRLGRLLSPRPDVSVLVVGAGSAGLVTAITLARQGVDVLVVERRPEPSDLPRAVGISLRQMEVLRAWGLDELARAGGDDVEIAVLQTVTVADAAHGVRHDMNAPTRAQSAVVSPTAPARVPQDHLEAVLAAHLASLSSAELRRRSGGVRGRPGRTSGPCRAARPGDGTEGVGLGRLHHRRRRCAQRRAIHGRDRHERPIEFGEGNPITVSCRPLEEGGVEVDVADRGRGIEPETWTHLDEFVQLSQPDQAMGTGLGLPISRRLAVLLGGTLAVKAPWARGTPSGCCCPPSWTSAPWQPATACRCPRPPTTRCGSPSAPGSPAPAAKGPGRAGRRGPRRRRAGARRERGREEPARMVG